MNHVSLVGRLTKDPDVRYTTGENASCVARFSVAVNRTYKNAEGKYDADFPSVIAFGRTGEFIEKYFHKGDMIGISGRIQTGRYTNKDGNTVYTTDVVAENVEFVSGKGGGTTEKKAEADDDWMNVDGDEEELPWNQ